jgi:2-C-methyl-D-erythritol 4-phosphate cytidylyltransferase
LISKSYWAVIPAAGLGSRMGANLPKQYLSLRGKTVIEHTLERFCQHPRIKGVMVAIARGDRYWHKLPLKSADKLRVVFGGEQRCHSVVAALRYLAELAAPEDWVLVHDAARPCLRKKDLDQLITTLCVHPVGGLLGRPVRDTMKRADAEGRVTETVDRQGLWHALTPQMFRLQPLTEAIERALAGGRLVTDEAQAMELAGHSPGLVEGHADNIKITHPEDLALAELYLRWQEEKAYA